MPEPQFHDTYEWVARYKDGEVLTEYSRETGEPGGFATVEQDRLKILTFEPRGSNLPHIGVLMNEEHPDMRPILFRRRRVPLDGTEKMETIHVIGWQRTIKGVNVKSYAWLFEDGSILLSDKDVV